MRKVVHVTAVAAAGLVLLACNRPPERQAVAYAPPPAQAYGNASYAHVGMPPALPPRRRAEVPPQVPPPHANDDGSYGRADVPEQEQRLVWKSSPRWATVKGEVNTPAVKRVSQTKFKDAQAKAEKVGVENLTGEDIAGLTPAQIKQLRGY
jgi:hypothetical protein